MQEATVDKVFNRVIDTTSNQIITKWKNKPRKTSCKIVPANHFGPVPGVPVGTSWKYRLQVSESGIHRPIVAGIHGRVGEGAYSIVISGVYADDEDHGEEVLYSGCGGSEKNPRRRFGPQIFDQELKLHNKALALSCNAPIDEEKGGDAGLKWRDGKPVRVVRKCNKFSIYSPEEGYRYDGIYKVVRYYPKYNKITGLRVWTYLLRRDDPTAAPWTDIGKRRIEKLCLKMELPEDDETAKQIENERIMSSTKRRTILKNKNPKKVKCKDVTRTVEPYLGIAITAVRGNGDVWMTDGAFTDSSDIDIKPDMNKCFISGAEIPVFDHPVDTYSREDVKPNIHDLNSMIYQNRETRQIKCEQDNLDHSTSSCPVDVCEEECKPNVNSLNIVDTVTEASHSSVQSMSVGSDPQSKLPYTISENEKKFADTTCQSTSNESLKIKISKVSSNSWRSQKCENQNNVDSDSNIPPTLKESNLLDPVCNRKSPIKIQEAWDPSLELRNFIDKDALNKSIWDYLKTFRFKEEVITRVRVLFSCPCCANMIDEPVTTPCGHNICYSCLKKHFEKKFYSCPLCHYSLRSDFIMFGRNNPLRNILEYIFPETESNVLN